MYLHFDNHVYVVNTNHTFIIFFYSFPTIYLSHAHNIGSYNVVLLQLFSNNSSVNRGR